MLCQLMLQRNKEIIHGCENKGAIEGSALSGSLSRLLGVFLNKRPPGTILQFAWVSVPTLLDVIVFRLPGR